MKKIACFLVLCGALSTGIHAQEGSALVDFDAYEKLVSEVKVHRASHLVTLETFQKMSLDSNVVILDTRSDSMYLAKHVKGAIHLNFSDFTQANLAKLIPDPNTKILIYCNNNFANDQIYFATKSAKPSFIYPKIDFSDVIKSSKLSVNDGGETTFEESQGEEIVPEEFIFDKKLTLALNIPTYINLFGYGYKNVYELSELISVYDSRIQFEGTAVGN